MIWLDIIQIWYPRTYARSVTFWRHCVPTFPLGLGVFAEAFSVPSTFTMYERSWTSTSVGEGVDEMYKTTHWLDILRPTTPPKKEHKLCIWNAVILKGSVFFSTLLKFQASNCLFYGDVLEEIYGKLQQVLESIGNLMPMSSVCFRSHEPWVICSSNSNNKHNKHRQDKEAKTQKNKQQKAISTLSTWNLLAKYPRVQQWLDDHLIPPAKVLVKTSTGVANLRSVCRSTQLPGVWQLKSHDIHRIL